MTEARKPMFTDPVVEMSFRANVGALAHTHTQALIGNLAEWLEKRGEPRAAGLLRRLKDAAEKLVG